MAARRIGSAKRESASKTNVKGRGRKSVAPANTMKAAQFRAITRALSDPTRYEILQHIAHDDACTCADLRESSPIGAATLSHHLKELEAAGLIAIVRRGKFALPWFRREVWKTY